MNAHEALAVFLDERHHVCLLAVVEVKFAGRAYENQGIEVIEVLGVSSQIFLGDKLDVGTQSGIPQSAVAAHVVDGDHPIGN